MRIITRNKKFFFTGEFKGLSPGYSLEITQLDPPEAEEHLSLLKNIFLMVVRESASGGFNSVISARGGDNRLNSDIAHRPISDSY